MGVGGGPGVSGKLLKSLIEVVIKGEAISLAEFPDFSALFFAYI